METASSFFSEVKNLIEELERRGHTAAAVELRDGYAALNGLTDGWALLLESAGRARHLCRDVPDLRKRLETVEEDAYRTVYRRPMPPWTRFFRHWGT